MEIKVSIGEIIDKITILRIKQSFITDEVKLNNVNNELNYLISVMNDHPSLHDELVQQLTDVNGALWIVEDTLRELEIEQRFEGEFIENARSVYRLNDKRAAIKKQINTKYGSEFVEEKSYHGSN